LLIAAHPERKQQYSRKYYQTHREKVLSYYQMHIATNPKRLAERNKKRRAYRRTRQAEEKASYKKTYAKRYANPQYRAARNALRTAERNASPSLIKQNRRRVLHWQKINPGKKNANGHNYRAREANAEGAWSAADFAAILVRQNNACFYCSDDITDRHHADHYIPLARGGSNWPSNIVAACADCNHRKGDKLPEEFSGRRRSAAAALDPDSLLG
jgi:5-methylcytosine-specific restriction endonuclease McrA